MGNWYMHFWRDVLPVLVGPVSLIAWFFTRR